MTVNADSKSRLLHGQMETVQHITTDSDAFYV